MVTLKLLGSFNITKKNYCTRSLKLLSRTNDYDDNYCYYNCTQPNAAYFALAPYTALPHIISQPSTTTRDSAAATG